MAGYDIFTIDLSNPIIIDDNGLKVTAFKVIHDPIEPALGFRFDYKGRSIVISGDTISTENTIKNSINADVLFHEAQANHIVKILENENKKVGNNLAAKIMADIVTYHTTPVEAAEIANQANVKHLVFYHLTPAPRNTLMERMFVRGVNDIRKEWTLSDDGTLVILPPNSEKIEITKNKLNMIFLLIKIIVTAGLIVLISEIAKVNDKLGGLIAAMPIMTLLVILWMYYEGNSDEKISSHMSYTLLYIVPTIPMFIVFPFVISKFGFYIAFLISILVTVISVTILNFLIKI